MPEWAMLLIGQGLTAVVTYGAIRADIREALVRASVAEVSADRANRRIDKLFKELE